MSQINPMTGKPYNSFSDFKKIGNAGSQFFDWLTGRSHEKEVTDDVNNMNLQIARETNETNLGIANQNLGFQRELQEYNKALQERMFEREDTAYQRTASDMLSAGLNPLTMQGTNGAGEAIALAPQENTFQAQQPNPMIKPTYNSPLANIANVLSSATSVAGSIGQLSKLSSERDILQQEAEEKRLQNIITARKYKITDGVVGNPFGDDNALREYNHKVKTNRYDSDTDPERIVTALIDALNGRYTDQVNDITDKVSKKVIDSVPMIHDAVEYVENDAREQSMQARASEKGYTLRKGQTTTTVVPHPYKQYNTIKVYDNKGNLIDEYDLDYDGQIIKGGTTTNSSGSSHKSGKF